MQSRDRAAPHRRARRGLAGDRRRHRPRSLMPPPRPPGRTAAASYPLPADDRLAEPRVRRGRTLSMQVTYSKRRAPAGGSVTATSSYRTSTSYCCCCYSSTTAVNAIHVHGDSTRRRPPSATSIMTPAPQRPLAMLPAVVLSRERDRPRYVCVCVCVCVCVFVCEVE